MKRWNNLSNFKFLISNFKLNQLTDILLQNRDLKTKKQIDEFLNPILSDVTVESVGIDKKELGKTLKRIKKAMDDKEQIVIFGDYDVDGITGTAILWETLYFTGANVMPYIPHRVDEGYGLSTKGISNVKFQMPNVKLIITVDNGIVAHEAIDFANKEGIEIIITDHHTQSQKNPDAFAIIHTTKLCGAGVAWALAQEIRNSKFEIRNGSTSSPQANHKFQNYNLESDNHLELVALGTIADLVPLVGANRTLVKFGLEKLRKTTRPGIVSLFKEAASEQAAASVYQISHVIAPRLNASGRMTTAMDSLRLLCTKNTFRAADLASKLGVTNRERQMVMIAATEHASLSVKAKKTLKKMLVVSHESYPEGVIGLVAGRLVEEYYRPSIVIAKGEKLSKGSVRSVSGFNMIEFLRSLSDYFVNVGGHPMAAGFTIETEKIALLQEKIEELSESLVDDGVLMRSLRIDCELPLSVINQKLYDDLQALAPFGMGNPEPTFVSYGVSVEDVRYIGKDGKHLKLFVSQENGDTRQRVLEVVAFGMGERMEELVDQEKIDVVYTIDENVWNGNKKLQLKIKDFKKSS